MKKKLLILLVLGALALQTTAFAYTYTIVKGDSLWKIAVRTQTGLSELIAANPQIANPALIYPGEKITVPEKNQQTTNYQAEVLRLVNVERANNGLRPLTMNWELQRVAQYKAEDLAINNYFSHNSPTYGTPFQMMKNFGIKYTAAGENIAKGQKTPQAVMNGWMNSSGHRANILNSTYTQLGVGYDSRANTWVQMFIKP